MNTKLFLPLVVALPMLAATSCDKAKDVQDNVENMDFSSMKPAELTTKATETMGALASSLGGITDLDGAKKAATDLLPKVAILEKLKGIKDFKMPAMDSVTGAITSLKEKFAGKADILGALEPLFKKITGLMG